MAIFGDGEGAIIFLGDIKVLERGVYFGEVITTFFFYGLIVADFLGDPLLLGIDSYDFLRGDSSARMPEGASLVGLAEILFVSAFALSIL